MKAFVYHCSSPAPHMAFQTNAPRPALKPGHVLVSVRAASLNPVDYKKPALIPLASLVLNGLPVGQDFAGTVLESASPALPPGARVLGTVDAGCLAETVLCAAAHATVGGARSGFGCSRN